MDLYQPPNKRVRSDNSNLLPPPPPPPDIINLYDYVPGQYTVYSASEGRRKFVQYFTPPVKAFRYNAEEIRREYLSVFPLYGDEKITETFEGHLGLAIKVHDNSKFIGLNLLGTILDKSKVYTPLLIENENGDKMLGLDYMNEIYLIEAGRDTILIPFQGNLKCIPWHGHNVIVVRTYNKFDTVVVKLQDNIGLLCLRYIPPENDLDDPPELIPYQY